MTTSTLLVERFAEHGQNGETIPDEWTLEEFEKRYPGIVKVVAISWWCGGRHLRKDFGGDISSATVLPDRSGILLVQSMEKHGGDNAVIVNANGTERFRLKNPYPANPYYQPGDRFEFLYPKTEDKHFGMEVAMSRRSKTGQGWVNVEWFYELDTDSGQFLSYHVAE